jgi:anti-sigma28 factor (negative regulator of flagellin synthesis)
MDMPNTTHLRSLTQPTPAACPEPTRSPIPSREARRHGAEFQTAVEQAAQGAAVDWYRVALFREAIAAGTYDLRPYRVAGSLIRFESLLCAGALPRAIGGPVVDYGDFTSAQDLLDRIYVLLCEESNHLCGEPAAAQDTTGTGMPSPAIRTD